MRNLLQAKWMGLFMKVEVLFMKVEVQWTPCKERHHQQ